MPNKETKIPIIVALDANPTQIQIILIKNNNGNINNIQSILVTLKNLQQPIIVKIKNKTNQVSMDRHHW